MEFNIKNRVQFDQLNNNHIGARDIAAVGYNYGLKDTYYWIIDTVGANNWSTDYLYADDIMLQEDGYFVYPMSTVASDLIVGTNLLTSDSIKEFQVWNYNYGQPQAYSQDGTTINNSETAVSARWFALGNPFDKELLTSIVLDSLKNTQGEVVYCYNAQTGQWENPETIKPGQGFMVAGNKLLDHLQDTNTGVYPCEIIGFIAYPTSSNKKSDIVEDTKIIFNSVANGTTSNVYARINKNAENNFDIIDSYKMLSTANDDLVDPYFVVDNKMVLIDEFKTLPYASPISFHASKISEVNFSVENVPEGVNVAIVDLNTNAETDLTNGEVFNFIAEEGENAGKYAIKFTKSSVGINEVNANEISMSLYPNPAVDKTTLTINGLDNEATITITDELGRVVNTMSIAAQQTNVTINTDNLASGVYYVKVVSNNTANTQKLIVR